MVQTREAVIVDIVRTPVGRKKGSLSATHPVDIAAHTLKALAERTALDPMLVEDVYMGCVTQIGDQSLNIGRNAILAAGWPIEIPAFSLDRQCGSALTALNTAAMAVVSGHHDIVVAAGVESMNREPIGSNRGEAPHTPYPPSLMERFSMVDQGFSADMIADKWGITREEMDAFSLRSHQRAAKAVEAGYFKSQIAPIKVTTPDGETKLMDTDECVRPNTTLEKLGSLKPAFQEGGRITAGNSSQISDGSAAALVTTPEKAAELGLKPRARIHATAVVGSDPILMLTGPIPVTRKILEKTGMTLDALDTVEVNEAFAPIPLAWGRELNPDWEKVNPNGGAIALGHPLGMTGLFLTAKALAELERTNGRYGLITLCTGGGTAPATIIERL